MFYILVYIFIYIKHVKIYEYIYMKSMHPQIKYSMVLCIFKQFLH